MRPRAQARPYYLAGGDSDDLIQEGMIGLIYGVREFDGERSASSVPYTEKGLSKKGISRGTDWFSGECLSRDAKDLVYKILIFT